MDNNIEFLNYIYQNAEMGKDTISELITIVEDASFKNILESQLKEYTEIFDISSNKIEQAKKTSKGIGTFSKFTTYLMINFKTMKNKTPSHIAEMLIQGSTMGIVDLTKKIKEYKDVAPDILALADRLLKFEIQNVDEMKKFL
ncbi:hypothetical protein LGK95_04315 [Clostridium algoriphilum]|uniref:hypothetical protein n=1 Tax=Clostridium algoriphilum TaxID=198347 RepID=UPI001CF5FA78|nr:hypothetical protein [Clostridium algoriphilum]MCB2292760.1 hypothetical protein [Clostridium algoriphilum]